MAAINYISVTEQDLLWGLAVTTVGVEEIAPGAHYPTDKHGEGYYYDTAAGRVLNEYQLVYIPKGHGSFESAHQRRRTIGAGTMFLLFPGEWHTYRPDPKSGWLQYWIGFKGPNIDMRVRHGFFTKESPIYQVGQSEQLVQLFQMAMDLAEWEPLHFQQMLAGAVNYLLGLTYMLDQKSRSSNSTMLQEKINQACVIMRDNIFSTVSMTDLAERVGMSYSLFRKAFKEYTGKSPLQYLQQQKIRCAKNMLTCTTLSVKEIAFKLNFDSPEYFSTKFKNAEGCSPSEYRASLSEGGQEPAAEAAS